MIDALWARRAADIFNALPYLMAIIDSDGLVVTLNDAMLQLMGLDAEVVVHQPYWELPCWVHSEDLQNRVLFAMEQSALLETEVRMESQFKDNKAHLLDIDFHIRALYEEGNHEGYFLATGFNVTDLVQARKALSEKERQMQALFEYSQEGFFMNILPEGLSPERSLHQGKKNLIDCLIDDFIVYQKIERFNPAFKRILGYDPSESISGNRMYELLQIHGRSYRDLVATILDQGEINLEHTIVDHKGESRILQIYMVLIQENGYYYGNFGVIRDLTIQRRNEGELEFYAFKDPLTGLNNRRTFFNKAKEYYKENLQGIVLMMDIDHFKRVNDTYGHAIGDEVLKGFAALLEAEIRDRGVVARYGGEEFVVLLPDTTLQEAKAVCECIRLATKAKAFQTENGDAFHITISLGLAEIWGVDTAVDTTITRADKALYASKQTGRDRYTVCTQAPSTN